MNAMELVALLGGWFVTMVGMCVGALATMGIVERHESGPGRENQAFFVLAPVAVLLSTGVCGKLTAWGYKRAYASFVRQLLARHEDEA